MADRFHAKIRIGGRVSRTTCLSPRNNTTILQGLIGALHDDGASHGYGGAVIPKNCNVALPLDDVGWARFLDNSGILTLKCDRAVNSKFEETEQFCIDYGIQFDRWSDRYFGWDAENIYWRPGMSIPIATHSDSNGNEIICGETVRRALKSLTNEQLSLGARIESSIRILKSVCLELPLHLESFMIMD